MNTIFSRAVRSIVSGASRIHFSQYGEDVFLHKKFRSANAGYFYIDVGAHHPFHLSNTAYLWSKGWNGVNIDASSQVIAEFNKKRSADLNLAFAVVSEAVATQQDSITFYFNKSIDNCATCDPCIAAERGLVESKTVRCTSLIHILELAQSKFQGKFGLLNIDIEGLDAAVIENIARWPIQPEVIMIELYAEDIPSLCDLEATKTILGAGYRLTQRVGHTAIFEQLAAK